MKQTISTKSVYLSGKISGLSSETARRNFMELEDFLQGYFDGRIVNPYEIGLPDEIRWQDAGIPDKQRWEMHMDRDLDLLRRCSQIYMLANWRESTGALIELKEAILLGLDITGHISAEEVEQLRNQL